MLKLLCGLLGGFLAPPPSLKALALPAVAFLFGGNENLLYAFPFICTCQAVTAETSHSAVLLLSKLLNVFFPIASLMGRDNGSGMLSAHAGDARAFVQHTCVVGTRPLCPQRGQRLAEKGLLVHLPLALEATSGSAPRNIPISPGGPSQGEDL